MRTCEKTCLTKYGVKNPFSNNEIKEKIKNTYNLKYGVTHNMQVKEIKEKAKLSKKITAYNKIKEKYKGIYEPIFSVEEYQGVGKYYFWKCCKCGNIFKSMYNNGSIISRCFNCYPRKIIKKSIYEIELENFIKSYNINYKINDKELIKPYELDIVIPELKLAIELNGDYWHSTEYKDKNYHLNKTIECEKIGYRLIHIFEHEWINKQNIIKQKLLSLFNINQKKIGARKCTIKEISTKEKNNFLNLNHIQGEDKAKIKLGLFYENELVAVMTFGKPRFNKKYEWELIRYAGKNGFRIQGGASKLLKYFLKKFSGKIITYADRCWSQGNLYFKLGFTLINIAEPNYIWSNGKIIYTRYQCQKHKLNKLLNNKFDKTKSENLNMLHAGFYKIYNCGNLVFELKN